MSNTSQNMRWPIHLQLLVPMVAAVLLASFLATAIMAWWIASRVRTDQRESLRRVVQTLGDATFPLNERVLRQMRGLSGAEFVLMTSHGRLQESTLPVERNLGELTAIAQSRAAGAGPDFRVSENGTVPLNAAEDVITLDGRNYLVDFVNITHRPHFTEPATFFILYPEDELTARIHQAVYPALIAGIVAAVAAVALATWLARRFVRPIRRLAAHTAEIAQGHFASMPPSPHNDELRDLADSINHMAAQLADYEQQVRHSERLRTLGQLGAAMAHQLRNAATGGRMAIELHRRDCPQGERDESLEVALRQLRLMESYLRQFLAIDESTPSARSPVDAAALVEKVLGLLRPSCIHAGVDLQWTPPAELPWLEGDADSLGQLVTNLIRNALDAAVSGPDPKVIIKLDQSPDGRGRLRVFDTGPGPALSVSEQLFNSIVTTKPDGFGLGLFVARQIAERHDGHLDWRREDEMTCFTFEFPLKAKN